MVIILGSQTGSSNQIDCNENETACFKRLSSSLARQKDPLLPKKLTFEKVYRMQYLKSLATCRRAVDEQADSVQDGIDSGSTALKEGIDDSSAAAQQAADDFEKRATEAADRVETNIDRTSGALHPRLN